MTHELRSEMRAADANINNIGNRFAPIVGYLRSADSVAYPFHALLDMQHFFAASRTILRRA